MQEHWYLVTGASSGIGYQTALQLAEIPGIHVLALARNTEKLEALGKAAGGKLALLSFDLSKHPESLIANHCSQLGITALRGLLNNAGHLESQPFLETGAQSLSDTFEVNVLSPYRLIQQLHPLLKASGGAHVVNVSSIGGVQGSVKFSGLSAYASSKGALNVLSECLALELAEDKIRVNALALGAVQTEMLSQAFPGYQAPISAEDMAGFVSWFLREGDRYFNGKILPVALSTP